MFREGKGYSGTAKGEKGESPIGSYDGYQPLVVEIVKYFRTGEVPVAPEETLALYAFMEAADESKRQDGKEIALADVLAKATRAIGGAGEGADKRIASAANIVSSSAAALT